MTDAFRATDRTEIEDELRRRIAELYGDERSSANRDEIMQTADALRRVHRLTAASQVRQPATVNS